MTEKYIPVQRHSVGRRIDGRVNLWRSFYDPVNREEINTNWEVTGVFDSKEKAWEATGK